MSGRHLSLSAGEESFELRLTGGPQELHVAGPGESGVTLRAVPDARRGWVLHTPDRVVAGAVLVRRDQVTVWWRGRTWTLQRRRPGQLPVAAAGVGSVVSPMTGKVVAVACTVGALVAAGETLVTVEAMKMEHRLTAPAAARVAALAVADGDQVDIGQVLVTLEPVEAAP